MGILDASVRIGRVAWDGWLRFQVHFYSKGTWIKLFEKVLGLL